LVVDSRILPHKGKVVILRHGIMEELEKAEIVMSDKSEFYELYDGEIVIKSKEEFQGYAKYDYQNDVDQKFTLKFVDFSKTQITVDSLTEEVLEMPISEDLLAQTNSYAISHIDSAQSFIFEDGKKFRGTAIMQAWNPKLALYGEFQLTLNGDKSPWIPLQGSGGKGGGGGGSSETIVKDETINGEEYAIGLYMDGGLRELYAPLMEEKRSKRDDALFMAEGILKSNTREMKNIIEPADRTSGLTNAGGRFEFTPKRDGFTGAGNFSFEGKLNLIKNTSKVTVASAGYGSGNEKDKNYEINTLIALLYDLKGETFKTLGKDIEDYLEENRDRDEIKRFSNKKRKTLSKIANTLTQDEADKFLKRFERRRFSYNNLYTEHALVLDQVNLKWDAKRKAFYSVGKIGIASILRDEIDALVEGYVEIPKADDDETFRIFLKFNPKRWYYIEHTSNKGTNILSADDDFNALIEDSKNKDKFKLADPVEKQQMLNRFKSYGK